MAIFSVLPDLCKQDGICASVCPAHCIKGPKGSLPFMRPEKTLYCIECGHCMAFCPSGAARIDALPVQEMLPIDRKRLPDAESVEALLRARRSTRLFKKEPLPKELLERILQATRHAPSAKNDRPVRYIVLYERESLKKLGDIAADWLERLSSAGAPDSFPEAKALAKAWRNGLDPLFRGAAHLVLAVTEANRGWAEGDSAIALTYLELAALPHGVGACWAGYITHIARIDAAMQEFLGIRPGEAVQGGQMLGYIALKPTSCAPRTPFPATWLDAK